MIYHNRTTWVQKWTSPAFIFCEGFDITRVHPQWIPWGAMFSCLWNNYIQRFMLFSGFSVTLLGYWDNVLRKNYMNLHHNSFVIEMVFKNRCLNIFGWKNISKVGEWFHKIPLEINLNVSVIILRMHCHQFIFYLVAMFSVFSWILHVIVKLDCIFPCLHHLLLAINQNMTTKRHDRMAGLFQLHLYKTFKVTASCSWWSWDCQENILKKRKKKQGKPQHSW